MTTCIIRKNPYIRFPLYRVWVFAGVFILIESSKVMLEREIHKGNMIESYIFFSLVSKETEHVNHLFY